MHANISYTSALDHDLKSWESTHTLRGRPHPIPIGNQFVQFSFRERKNFIDKKYYNLWSSINTTEKDIMHIRKTKNQPK